MRFTRFVLHSLIWCIVLGLIVFAINRSYHLEEESDFVILVDKVGDPVIMTVFRMDPAKYDKENEDPNYCDVGGDELYSSWNVSVFTAANEGDVLRRHHYTYYYQIFGRAFLVDCYERFMPVKVVSLYPDRTQWPFRESDPKEKQ